MLQDELGTALAITRKMRDAMQAKELDIVEQLARERDGILHKCFPGGGGADSDDEAVSAIVKEIVHLNNEMIELGNREKSAMQAEVDKEMKASSGIRKYIDNMRG